MFANVVVDVRSSNVDIVYTYKIPDIYSSCINIGSRVLVGFGVREVLGYVIEIVETHNYDGLIKDIIDVLDFEKELTVEQVELAKMISHDTRSLMVSALDLMYPSFLRSKYRKYLITKNYQELDADVALIFNGKNKVLLDKSNANLYSKIKKEIDKGNVELSYDAYSYGKNKHTKCYYFNSNIIEGIDHLTKKRQEVIDYVRSNASSTLQDIKEATGCSKNLVDDLVKNDYLIVKDEIIISKPFTEQVAIKLLPYNFEQKELRDKYYRLSGKPFILYSNDDDFKLNFYIDIISENIRNNKKTLIVTPTLLKNYSILSYIRGKLNGYNVVNISSELSNSEYFDNYMAVKTENFDVVITTKVGAFLPFTNLGTIIVVDDENENYLCEANPKYNIRKVMEFRSEHLKARLIFSTTTGSVETYYKYFITDYFMLRYIVPNKNEAILIDMKKEYSKEGLFSNRLIEEIKMALYEKKVSLLILNAKKYSNFIICRKCSSVLKCPICKVPLSYNKKKDEISCKYCGYKLSKKACLKCDNEDLSYLSAGLEQINEKISMIFPKAKIMQLDSDEISDFDSYNEALLKIEDEKVDIIIGTHNMISLKNERIKLIGILDIDRILNNNDYRSSEMAYSLLANSVQNKNTTVIVQGYHLDNEAVVYGINNQFEDFFNNEMKYREQLQYPPFFEANRLIISGDYRQIYHYANSFKKSFNYLFKDEGSVLGPVYLAKYSGVQLIIKHNDFEKVLRIIDEVSKNLSQYDLKIIYERYPKSFS